MTIPGKILVFANLVLACVTAWFIAMTFTKDVNWKEATDQYKRQYDVVVADAHSLHDNDLQRIKAKDAEKDQLQKQIDAAQMEKTNLTSQITSLKATQTQLQDQKEQMQANLSSMQAQVARVQQQLAQMQQAVDKKSGELIALQKQMQDVRDEAVSKEIAYSQERKLNSKLRAENEQITQENARLKQNGPAGNASSRVETFAAKPPPEDVDGVITDVETHEGLVTLSIGSDNGLSRGQTMEVYRLSPKPEYVGMIRILQTHPHEAVAKAILPLRAGPIRKGDQVAARLTGRK